MKHTVYISAPKSHGIDVWNLNKNGEMNFIQKVKTDGEVQPISIIKNKNLLYAGIRPKNRIIIYDIDKNGCLKKNNESFLPGNPNYIAFDEKKEFLFCSSYNSNCISVSQLDQFNIPKKPIQIIYDIQGCHASEMNYKYNMLFVTALKEDCIYLYELTEFGILRNTEQILMRTLKKSGPRHICFHPNQDVFYTINELNGTIDVWYINKKSYKVTIKNIQNINILPNYSSKMYWSSDIHLTSCGRFLYVSDRILNIISLFHVDTSNNCQITFFRYYKTKKQPRSFCINPTDKYLIVASQISNTCTVYHISSNTGELEKLNTYTTSKGPLWVYINEQKC
ncbi:6-phosphogluconolactonase [Buchnera aphidicola (Muscaphis stroyani)]|uniref:6-phosphogluconolactonase n=1 Tax=Buchnera aphidicola (Muscaphis stroyani) TaxID=1241869 RepID=A0A4D6YEW2_9GAMM|nr:6-phosphogluconolactonase [Buchnera aphidicola]QCI24364.1 6-phosphogluconolactonase [Buchnera aphidicola (Muscaphis stroyani)]